MNAYEHIKYMRRTLSRVEELIDVKHPEPMPVDEIKGEMDTLSSQAEDLRQYAETQRERL